MSAPAPTPETDAKWHQVYEELPFTLAASDPIGGLGEIVPADFARTLERERGALKAECEALRKALEETPCERLLLQEMSLADSQVSSSCEPCTCWRKALAPR